VYRVEVDDAALVDMLVSSGHLPLLSADDPEKVRRALERLVSSLVAMDVHMPGRDA
jgi:CheY-like chemotaxis protein